MARLACPTRRPEGRFFPDTYFFAAGSSGRRAAQPRAHARWTTRLAAAWEHRATDLPFTTPYEALILASIVEKETGRAADRPLIASVFVNRLRKGMRLQTDPDGDLRPGRRVRRRPAQARPRGRHAVQHLHARRPAADADRAAVAGVARRGRSIRPSTEYLYFVARGDGTSKFSATLAEHNRAVSRFQKGGR